MLIIALMFMQAPTSALFFLLLGMILMNFQSSNPQIPLTEHADAYVAKNSSQGLQVTQTTSHKLKVLSSFFPIGEFTKKVGGDAIESSLFIPNGVEPHDYDPTINDIQRASSADVLIYNGFNLESWIEKINIPKIIDASLGLNFLYTDRTNKTIDPHVWLDPLLAKEEVKNIANALIKIDPTNKNYYSNNTMHFLSDLDNLDKFIREHLKSCKKKDFISFHSAFSYFAKRYGLTQHSVTNTSPEAEITPQQLTEIINTAKRLQLNVIYSEELIDPRHAAAIAQEIPGGKVLELSPIEGLTKEERQSGVGYMDKMLQNVKNLMEGLDCKKP